MSYESLTDEKISELILLQKKITNPSIQQKFQAKYMRLDYKVVAINDLSITFNLYVRQNLLIQEDFSCGLCWYMPSGETITLIRYNGNSHKHKNSLEKETLHFEYHIHRASEKYIVNRSKPDGFAISTDRYADWKSALYCAILDCNIQGLSKISENTDDSSCQLALRV